MHVPTYAVEKAGPVNMKTLEERVKRVTRETVAITPYDPEWPRMFEQEKKHLLKCLPKELVKRIEHIGSTAVPNLPAKPVIDILVEVTSLEETKKRIVPLLNAQKYDYFWRPTFGDDVPPFYAWFIKRDSRGDRTHHIHMVEKDFDEHWDRLFFRDYLIEFPDVAKEYRSLKLSLAHDYPNDRVVYAKGKKEFIDRVTWEAKKYYKHH
jgi:GrpB-like predicted nucleotidyltransferase (UPF0157 family)